MEIRATLCLLLVLVAQVASLYPNVVITGFDFETIPKGMKPVSVTRTVKLDFNYNLVGTNTWSPWTKFPQLDDQIELEFAQEVRITYLIFFMPYPVGSHFRIRLLINNVEDKRFTYFCGYSEHDRTIHVQNYVRLPKGTYTIRIEYITTNAIPNQKFGEWGMANFLEIQHYKLVNATSQ